MENVEFIKLALAIFLALSLHSMLMDIVKTVRKRKRMKAQAEDARRKLLAAKQAEEAAKQAEESNKWLPVPGQPPVRPTGK